MNISVAERERQENPEYSIAPLALAINTGPFVSMFYDKLSHKNIYTDDTYSTQPQLWSS
jgi:hypothetical protein